MNEALIQLGDGFVMSCLQAERPIGYEKGDAFEVDDTLAVTLGARVKQALAGGNSEPLRCSACRTAGRMNAST